METRLIIAYSIITVMVALAIFGWMWVSKKRKAEERRTSGRVGDL